MQKGKKNNATLNIPEIAGSVLGSIYADNVLSGGSGIPTSTKSAMNPALTALISNISYQYALGLKPVSDMVLALGVADAVVIETVYTWAITTAYAMAVDKENADVKRRLIQAIVQVYSGNLLKNKTF